MSTRRNGRDLDLWAVDPGNPPSDRLVLQLQGGGTRPSIGRRRPHHPRVAGRVRQRELPWLVDVAQGEKTLLAPQPGSESVAYRDAKFSRDGRGIYLSTDQGSEFQRLAYLDLANQGLPVLTTAIPWDVDEFDLSPTTVDRMRHERGRRRTLHVLNAATGAGDAFPRLPAA